MKPVITIKTETEYEFWKRYLEIIQTSFLKRNRLTDSELRLMSYIMTQPPHRDCFKEENREDTMSFLNIKYHNLYVLRQKLVNKGWYIDKLPDRKLIEIQKDIKAKLAGTDTSVSTMFTFHIDLKVYNGRPDKGTSKGDSKEIRS